MFCVASQGTTSLSFFSERHLGLPSDVLAPNQKSCGSEEEERGCVLGDFIMMLYSWLSALSSEMAAVALRWVKKRGGSFRELLCGLCAPRLTLQRPGCCGEQRLLCCSANSIFSSLSKIPFFPRPQASPGQQQQSFCRVFCLFVFSWTVSAWFWSEIR